jgi:hypothetical protein
MSKSYDFSNVSLLYNKAEIAAELLRLLPSAATIFDKPRLFTPLEIKVKICIHICASSW